MNDNLDIVIEDVESPVVEELKYPQYPDWYYKRDYELIDTDEKYTSLLQWLSTKKDSLISFDVETNSKDWRIAKLVGFGFSWKRGQGAYVPVAHNNYYHNIEDWNVPDLKVILETFNLNGSNLKYDWHVMRQHGIDINIASDSMIVAWLLNADRPSVGLKAVCSKEYGLDMFELVEDIPLDDEGVANLNPEEFYLYACSDNDLSLSYVLDKEEKIKKLGLDFLYRVEIKFNKLIAVMEENGVKVDIKYFEDLKKEVIAKSLSVEKEIYEITDREFKINSPAQLGKVLFDSTSEGGLGLPVLKRTKTTKKPSTDGEVLSQLATEYSICQKILTYKKLVSTNGKIKRYLTDVNPDSGLIKCSYLLAHVPTGRTASASPNMQQIPEFMDYGEGKFNIRKGFIPSGKDRMLCNIDYKQIEFRILMSEAGETEMVEKIEAGHDPHRETAFMMFGIDYNEVDKDKRDIAKTINYGLIYGMESWRLATMLKVEQEVAEELMITYFSAFPKVKIYIAKIHRFVKERKYVKTKFNRIRFLPDVDSSNKKVQGHALRGSVNSIIQGSAADIFKIGSVRAYLSLVKKFPDIKMIQESHDSNLLDMLRSTNLDEFEEVMRGAFCFPIKGYCKMDVNFEYGESWGELYDKGTLMTASLPLEKTEDDKVVLIALGDFTQEDMERLKLELSAFEGEKKVYLDYLGDRLELEGVHLSGTLEEYKRLHKTGLVKIEGFDIKKEIGSEVNFV